MVVVVVVEVVVEVEVEVEVETVNFQSLFFCSIHVLRAQAITNTSAEGLFDFGVHVSLKKKARNGNAAGFEVWW